MSRRFRPPALAGSILVVMLAMIAPLGSATAQSSANDVVMVLPFENTSNKAEYNWVGESFADALSELLNVPGLVVVSGEERELAYQRVNLPLTTLPSRATSIKIAREVKASLIVLGTYKIVQPPATATTTGKPAKPPEPEIQGMARVIKVNEGRLMGEMIDGSWATRVYDFGGRLTSLQEMQGRLAYEILSQRDKALPESLNQFLQRARDVPPRAFEAYIKGALTDNIAMRQNYLKNALHEYASAKAGAVYPQAAFELGEMYMQQKDWKQAAEYFSKLQKKDPHYTEAAFYAGLAYSRLGNYESALDSLLPLTLDLPLTGVFNNAGAISLQASREAKKEADRARLLAQGTNLLKKAAESSAPDDSFVRFNYAYALFLGGNFAEAADQLRPVIASDPRDGQAYFLLAKALERVNGQSEAATNADNLARRHLSSYAKLQLEWQKSASTANVALRLRDSFNRADYFAIKGTPDNNPDSSPDRSTQELLAKARDFYQAGQDDEALGQLRQVLLVEPTSAEAYLMIGRIKLRSGSQDQAISALKTAIFWDRDTRLIDAHILLGRIFMELGDRVTARAYASSAIKIDPNNQEAIALQRLVETGGK